jgi:hypothetical protein
MMYRLGVLLATIIFTTISFTTTALWAAKNGHRDVPIVLAGLTGAKQLAKLTPQTQQQFSEYRRIPHIFGYRAFAIDPAGNHWGLGTRAGFVKTAIANAIAVCNKQSNQKCRLFAVGDIIVHGLINWKAETALMLYQVNRAATEDDLELVVADEPSAQVAALRTSIFFRAAEMGSVPALKAMLDRGVDIDARSPAGSTALLYAASRGQYQAVEHLLQQGADVNARNNIGRTALGLASIAKTLAQQRDYRMADHNGVVELFNKAGAVE